jgi:hypothetical protein
MAKKKGLGPRGLKIQAWIDARKRHNLSHAHVQMARELGLNPTKLGKLDNHDQEPWKAPLPVFIEDLYERRFGKRCPDVVKRAEDGIAALNRKKEEHRQRKHAAKRQGRAGSRPPEAALGTVPKTAQPEADNGAESTHAVDAVPAAESPKTANLHNIISSGEARQLSMFDEQKDR